MVDFPDTISAVELVLRYAPDKLKFLGIKDKRIFNGIEGGETIFLSYVDTVRGVIVVDIANFGELGVVKGLPIAVLTFTSVEGGEVSGFLGYEIIDGVGRRYSYESNRDRCWEGDS